MSSSDQDFLEFVLHTHGLEEVLDGLAEACRTMAENTLGDAASAENWAKSGRMIDRLCQRVSGV